MPVYEYQCKACHRVFEYQQRMADPEKTECEACKGELERLISRTAFQLKGSGWYKDLYGAKKPDAPAKDPLLDMSTLRANAGLPDDPTGRDAARRAKQNVHGETGPLGVPAANVPEGEPGSGNAETGGGRFVTPSQSESAKPSGGGDSGGGGAA